MSTASAQSPSGALSARELQVLEMIARGLTNRQIASELHITIHAVKFHLASIFRKLGVVNRTEAAVAFLRDTSRPVSQGQPA